MKQNSRILINIEKCVGDSNAQRIREGEKIPKRKKNRSIKEQKKTS